MFTSYSDVTLRGRLAGLAKLPQEVTCVPIRRQKQTIVDSNGTVRAV